MTLTAIASTSTTTDTTAGVTITKIHDNPPWPPPCQDPCCDDPCDDGECDCPPGCPCQCDDPYCDPGDPCDDCRPEFPPFPDAVARLSNGLWFGQHIISLAQFDEYSRNREDTDIGRYAGIAVNFVRGFRLTVGLNNFTAGPYPVNLGSRVIMSPNHQVHTSVATGVFVTPLTANLYASTVPVASNIVLGAGFTAGTDGTPNQWANNYIGNLHIPAGVQQLGEAQAILDWLIIWDEPTV